MRVFEYLDTTALFFEFHAKRCLLTLRLDLLLLQFTIDFLRRVQISLHAVHFLLKFLDGLFLLLDAVH